MQMATLEGTSQFATLLAAAISHDKFLADGNPPLVLIAMRVRICRLSLRQDGNSRRMGRR